MSQESNRYDDMSEVEQLATEQHIRYTYTGGVVAFHAPEGDKIFNWFHRAGIQNTLQWLKERAAASKIQQTT